MNAYLTQTRPRQSGDANVIVIPSAFTYTEKMATCHQAAYGYTADQVDVECLTPDKFRRHIQIFPEGQFMALDVPTDTVIGTTTSMRVDFNPRRPSLKSWAEITGDG
jgi:hypothetical protein